MAINLHKLKQMALQIPHRSPSRLLLQSSQLVFRGFLMLPALEKRWRKAKLRAAWSFYDQLFEEQNRQLRQIRWHPKVENLLQIKITSFKVNILEITYKIHFPNGLDKGWPANCHWAMYECDNSHNHTKW